MAATCLFLAYKVEECVRKMRELVVACVRVAQKDPHKIVDEQDKEYWRWRDNILQYEDLLLEAICFDLSLEPPYKTLFDLLVHFEQGDNKKLRNAAWAFVNDSCLTTLCLLFPSRTIAASALYAAAKFCDVTFRDDARGRPWWEALNLDIGSIRRACNYMASIYENGPAKAGKEVGMYERTPENEDEREDKTRSAGHGKIEDGRSSRGSNDCLVSPLIVSPEGSQAGGKRGREEAGGGRGGGEREAETERRPSVNGVGAHGANGNADGSRKRQKITEEPLRNGCAPPRQTIPHRPTTTAAVPQSERPAQSEGGLESSDLEGNGSEEGELEA